MGIQELGTMNTFSPRVLFGPLQNVLATAIDTAEDWCRTLLGLTRRTAGQRRRGLQPGHDRVLPVT